MECLADFSMCQVLIYIIKKRKNKYKKKLGGHKPNLVNPHKVYVNPNGWYKEIKTTSEDV